MQVGAEADLQTAISSLLRAAEQAEIVRWIEFPNSALLFLLVPRDPESGAVYSLDRKTGTWYSVDFDDKQYGGYSVSQLDQLLQECNFLAVLRGEISTTREIADLRIRVERLERERGQLPQ